MKISEILDYSLFEDKINHVNDLEKSLLSAKKKGIKLNYDSIDSIMQKISKKYNITGDKLHKDFVKKHKLIPDNWIKENFADGRNPQDKGDSARHGIPKKASISQLEKIRSSKSSSPRKKQLAHWQINMRRGRKKK